MKFNYLPFQGNSKSLIAGFTLKNPNYKLAKATIGGLNIGLNDLENREVVFENRKLFFNSIGINEDCVSSASQVHGNDIAYVEKPGQIIQNVDGLYTNKKGICLLIQVADCAPILLFDDKAGIIAVVHAGWRGAATGVLINMIEKMTELGAIPNQIELAIGPCIEFNNFEVGEEVAQVFPKSYSKQKSNEKYLLNLKLFLKEQAIEKGLNSNKVQVSEKCSIADVNDCYSHRREKNKAGRMGGFIYLKP